MNYYTKANHLADVICSLPYASVILGILYAGAIVMGFSLYLFATDAWNLHYCLAGGV
jgi:hypothetical protein